MIRCPNIAWFSLRYFHYLVYESYEDPTPRLKVHRGINLASSTFSSLASQRYIDKASLQRRKMRGDMGICVEGKLMLDRVKPIMEASFLIYY